MVSNRGVLDIASFIENSCNGDDKPIPELEPANEPDRVIRAYQTPVDMFPVDEGLDFFFTPSVKLVFEKKNTFSVYLFVIISHV